MKKSVRKKLLGIVLASFLVAGTAGVAVSQRIEEKPNFVYAFDNVNELPATTSTEYFATYAVGETFTINSYKITLNGEEKTTYAILQKDFTVYASLSNQDDSSTYKFTEAGEYNLMYFYVTETHARVVVRNIALSVSAEQAYFDVAFEKEYSVNSAIEVEASCKKGEKSVSADVQVLSPFGTEVAVSGGSVTLSQSGLYTIKYTAQIDGESLEKTYYIHVISSAGSYKDYFTSVSGTVNAVDDMQAPAYAKAGSGVGLTTDVTATIRFNNVIDLTEMTAGQDVIKLLPLTEGDYGIISQFSVQLIDIYDSTNVIEWRFKRYSKGESSWLGAYTYCNIAYNGKLYALHPTKGLMVDSSTYGVGTRICCNAAYLKTNAGGMYYGYAPWARCQIDYSAKKFFTHANNSSGALSYVQPEQLEVIDLDEPSYVGYGNEWQGFTTGEVYLQIDVQASGAQSGFIVQEVAGQKLYGEMQDSGAPRIYFDAEENGMLPDGKTDTFYPFSSVSYTNDIFEGTKIAPEYTVTKLEYELLKDRAYTDIAIKDQDGFTPNKAGTYRVTYQVTDESGNVGERKAFFTIYDNLGAKGVEYEMDSNLYVGKTITIPTLEPQGLSYLVKREESILYVGKEYIQKAGEELLLDKAGEFVIKCDYEDYLGNTYQMEERYHVVALDQAITSLQGVVPKYALKGRTIVLPDYSAINYSKNEQVAWTLTVDGVAVNTTTREVTIDGDNYEKIDVVYTADGSEERYQITVIDAQYLSDRFYATEGNVAFSNEKTNVVAQMSNDATIEYVFPFVLDNSTFNFGFDIEGEFAYVDVYFEDYLDIEQSLFLRLRKKAIGENEQVTAQINGEGQEFVMTPATKHAGYTFSYSHADKTFQFESSVLAQTTLAGEKFEGFKSNRLNVRMVINGVTQATTLRFYQIGAVTFLSTFDSQDNLQKYVDSMFPVLVGARSYLENNFKYGSTALIPGLEARTALSGGCKNSLTVKSPSGKTVLNNVNGYNDYEIELTEYGAYELTYTVPFRATTKKYKYTFRVHKEEPPVIELVSTLYDTYAYGETLVFPEISVTNASAEYTVDYYITKPNGTMSAITKEEIIKLDQYGVYALSVYVTDEYNVTFKRWTFKVEG